MRTQIQQVLGSCPPLLTLRRRRHQRGQVMSLVAIFALLLVLVIVLVMNSGYLSTTKLEAQNAADTSAYTVALWDARALNLLSVVNLLSAFVATSAVLFLAVKNAIYVLIAYNGTAIIATCAMGLPVCVPIVEEFVPLVEEGYAMRKVFKAATPVLADLTDAMMDSTQGIAKVLHEAASTQGKYLAERNGVDGIDLFSPTFNGGLPFTEGKAATMSDHVRHGRLGGYDQRDGLDAAEDWSNGMASLIASLQKESKRFEERANGPIWQSADIEFVGGLPLPSVDYLLPAVVKIIDWFKVAPTTLLWGGEVAAAGDFLLTAAYFKDSKLPGTKWPVVLTADWKDTLVYLAITTHNPDQATAHYLPSRFPNSRGDSVGIQAVAQAHIYNPYRPTDGEPDLFTPQWRPKLQPVDTSLFGTWLPGDLIFLQPLIRH